MTAFPLNDTNYYAEDMRLFHAGRSDFHLVVPRRQAFDGESAVLPDDVLGNRKHIFFHQLAGLPFCICFVGRIEETVRQTVDFQAENSYVHVLR